MHIDMTVIRQKASLKIIDKIHGHARFIAVTSYFSQSMVVLSDEKYKL